MAKQAGKAGGGKHQRSWKNFLIDKDYQLRYTVISVVIAAILCGALGTLVIWQTRDANSVFKKQRAKATQLAKEQRARDAKLLKQQRDEATQQFGKTRAAATKDVKKLLKVATDMLKVQLQDPDPDMVEFAKKAMKDLRKDDKRIVERRKKEDKALADQRAKADAAAAKLRAKNDAEQLAQRKHQDKEAADKRSRREVILIVGIVVFGVVFLIVIFIFNIVVTHRVAGPLFKMGRYMDELRDGKFTEVWNLRKGDQLVDFYSRFQTMHKAVQARAEKDVEVLEAAVKASEEAGAKGEAFDELKALLAEKRTSLGLDKEE